MTEDDRYLLTAIELAQRARDHGNHPFGALLVDAVREYWHLEPATHEPFPGWGA